MIAMGVVFVLLLGEIDLSIGFVSGIAGVVVAELQTGGNWTALPGLVAIVVAVARRARRSASSRARSSPSSACRRSSSRSPVLLAWQGVIQKLIGATGVIVIQDKTIFNVANYFLSDTLGLDRRRGRDRRSIALSTLAGVVSRRRARHLLRQPRPRRDQARRSSAAAIVFLVSWLNTRRAASRSSALLVIVLLVFLTWVAKRTTFGRHVYAVGGNAEAARRAGINVQA